MKGQARRCSTHVDLTRSASGKVARLLGHLNHVRQHLVRVDYVGLFRRRSVSVPKGVHVRGIDQTRRTSRTEAGGGEEASTLKPVIPDVIPFLYVYIYAALSFEFLNYIR